MSAEASKKIDDLIAGLEDWRGERLAEVRALIREALPGVDEEWKWMGSPVWESNGILAVGNAHKAKVKLTFPEGAHLDDPDHLFNNGSGSAWRAIDIAEGDALDGPAFQALVKRAAAYNAEKKPAKKAAKSPKKSSQQGEPR